MIRIAASDDIPEILRMAVAFHEGSNYGKLFPLALDHVELGLERLITGGNSRVYVSDKAVGRLNGMIGLVCADSWLSGEAQTTELFWWVDDKNKGVGIALLRCAEVYAAANSTMLNIIVPPGMEWLGEYLESEGYSKVETIYQKQFRPC